MGYEPRPIPLSKASVRVWKRTDIVPGGAVNLLQGKLESLNRGETELRRRTYPACAQAMAGAVREGTLA